MTLEMKSNLSQIFRQADGMLNHQTDQNQRLRVPQVFKLRAKESTFVVDNKFALQLDEII